MRLGARHEFFSANSIAELEVICEILDKHRLSVIQAPKQFWNWTDEMCWEFGQKARTLGIFIGEAGFWENLLDPEWELVTGRISQIRLMLKKADCMGVKCVVTLVGSRDVFNGPLSPHPYNFSNEAKNQYREVCLRIVDGLELQNSYHATEPWHNTFFYSPDEILEFIRSVNSPRSMLHLDQTNMISQTNYFFTTNLINRTFDLLSPYVVSVHAKDILWDAKHKFIKLDEVCVGDGIMDYDTFLMRLSLLDTNMPVFTEHYRTKDEFIIAIDRLHEAANKVGLRFLGIDE